MQKKQSNISPLFWGFLSEDIFSFPGAITQQLSRKKLDDTVVSCHCSSANSENSAEQEHALMRAIAILSLLSHELWHLFLSGLIQQCEIMRSIGKNNYTIELHLVSSVLFVPVILLRIKGWWQRIMSIVSNRCCYLWGVPFVCEDLWRRAVRVNYSLLQESWWICGMAGILFLASWFLQIVGTRFPINQYIFPKQNMWLRSVFSGSSWSSAGQGSVGMKQRPLSWRCSTS